MTLPLLTSVSPKSETLGTTLEFDLEKTELARKRSLLRLFDIISLTIIVLYLIAILVLFLFTKQLVGGTFGWMFAFIGLTFCATSYWLVEIGHYILACRLWIGSWLTLAMVFFWVSGTAAPLLMWLLMITVLTLVLMTVRATVIVTTICVGEALSLYLVQNVLHIYQPLDLTFEQNGRGDAIVNNALPLILIMLLLILPARDQTKAMQKWNRRLQLALVELAGRQATSQEVSHQVLTLAAELNTVAIQQASGSQEQVAVVIQVNASVSELTKTAGNIAELAQAISSMAEQVVKESRSIQDTTTQATEQSGQGLYAVEKSVVVSKEVAQLYQGLLSTMQEQNQKNNRMRRILELLNSIAAETHLLSLNAAIEAAGAGTWGTRFGVIAQEVKSLANRSAVASKEVVEIVEEIANGTELVMKAAENGYSKANQMKEAVQQTGQVIRKMREVVEHSQSQANLIGGAVSDARDLGILIVAATAQQRSASEQVMSALVGLGTVAHQGLEGSNLVSSTAINLKVVSQNLNVVLSN